MESLGGFAPSPISTPRSQTPLPQGASAETTADTDTATASSPQAAEAHKKIALDDEVQSVVSGLTSFWGRVKKQGTAALQTAEKQYESARADLTPLISQARANLDHLGEQTRAEILRLSETPAAVPGQGVMIGADGMPVILDEVPPPKVDKGKGVDRSGDGASTDAAPVHDAQQTPAAAATAFFASLAKNPNVKDLSRNLSTLQTGVSRNLHQLQSQLTHLDLAEGQKVAEGYLHKGEHWFQEFSAEVGKLAKDAVKVVPPGAPGATGSASPSSGRASMDKTGAASALSRRELVLFKLRTDAALLLADPAASPESHAAYSAFVAARGAFDGEAFQAQIERELENGSEALAATRDELVPAQLDSETFWTRYFWRKQAIEAEEERRKKVLQIADQSEDDFSWDMDDEDGASSAASQRLGSAPSMTAAPPSLAAAVASAAIEVAAPAPPPAVAHVAPLQHANHTPTPTNDELPAPASARSLDVASAPSAPAAAPAPPTTAAEHPSPPLSTERSPRASSDGAGSYDVVNAASGLPSGDERETAGSGARAQDGAEAEDEEDSDWE